MASLIEAIDIKRKMYFEFEGAPYHCLDVEVSKPTARGGQTLVRIKMRNLLTRAVFDKTFKAAEKFAEPDLVQVPATYQYTDGDAYHFMEDATFETLSLTADTLGDDKDLLTDNLVAKVQRPAPEAPSPGCTAGSCACGQVAYKYEGEPLRMLNCHCSRCRQGRSAAHTTNIFVPLDRFRFRHGEELVRDFRLPGARFFGVAFCAACGSDVPRKSLERNAAVIPAGGLDSDPGARPSAHIYVGSKAPWYDITDGLPQFQEMPS